MKHLIWLVFAVLTACATSQPAPVIERAPAARTPPTRTATPAAQDTRPDFHLVKKGDTLYSIGLENGIDYREIAAWNGITPPYPIRIGQQLRLKPPAPVAAAPAPAPAVAPADDVVTAPLSLEPPPVGRPLDQAGPAAADTVAPAASATADIPLFTEPRAIRQPYSGLAMAAPAPTEAPAKPAAAAESGIDWGWPAIGKVISGYNDSTGANKGIKIAGTQGQPVFAAAAGRVVYSGSGLRGYGNLVIVKHDDTYLSAYAHNSKLLVKEGQTVAKGQKIAEMGSSDAPQVQLHFEIRKLGRPVNPALYLPASPG